MGSYKLSIDLDPQFALAYMRLGLVYANTGQASLARPYFQKAFDLRDRTTDRDRFYIIANYYTFATGEINRAIEDYEFWRSMYPRDPALLNNLAADYLEVGEPSKAVEAAQSAVRLDPANKFLLATLIDAYAANGNYAQAKSLCDDPAQENSTHLGIHEACFHAEFGQNDEAAMQRQLQWAHGNPEEHRLLDAAALAAVHRGNLSDALLLFDKARQSAMRNHFDEGAADVELDKANIEAEFQLPAEARKDTIAALALDAHASEQSEAALAFARSGDVGRAKRSAMAASTAAPTDTVLNAAILPSVNAAIAIDEHRSSDAVQSLSKLGQLEFVDVLELAPTYYRGLAYMQAHQPAQAAKEFERVISHRTLANYQVYVPLAELKLGRAYQLLGDNQHADQTFRALALTWAEADPNFQPRRALQKYEAELVVAARRE
jgi:eukaryotic-like serine/threonine-protein kinase